MIFDNDYKRRTYSNQFEHAFTRDIVRASRAANASRYLMQNGEKIDMQTVAGPDDHWLLQGTLYDMVEVAPGSEVPLQTLRFLATLERPEETEDE
jgi:hypothetical protein